MNDEKYILHGPKPTVKASEYSLGVQLFESLLKYKHLSNSLIDAVTGVNISYSTLLEKTCLLAENLKNYGLKRNDVIGISSENSQDFFYPVIAALYLGIIVTTFNPSYTIKELIHTAAISKPKIIFCSEITLPNIQKAAVSEKIVILDRIQNINDIDCLDQFISNNATSNFKTEQFKPISFSTEQVAFILYSSGTTGLPKGVMVTHKNVNVRYAIGRDSRFYQHGDPGSECVLGLLPFYHAFGLFVAFFNLMHGNTVIVLKRFHEETFLKTIQVYRITIIYLVPPLVVVLAKSNLLDKYDLSSLVEASCGAAPLSKEIQETLSKRLNIKWFRQGYGLTETTLGVVGTPYSKVKDGSCGIVYPYMSAKIVDIETRKLLGPYQKGELCFKGDLIMKGYVGNIEATKNAFDEDGWLCTGDIGYYDEDKYIYIVDRLKELIKYKGFQVAPAELEALLVTHPKIKDAGVIGLPDELAGELPFAFIVKQDGQTLTEAEVKHFISEQVSSHKRLRGGVKFVNEIPKNPSGKILRNKLRELMQKQKSQL